jgi:hypothetical protein
LQGEIIGFKNKVQQIYLEIKLKLKDFSNFFLQKHFARLQNVLPKEEIN